MFRPLDEQSSPKPILLVDDQEEVRLLMSRVLRDAGYSVLEARDGTEALDVLAEGIQIQLLITDIQMPGLNGVELARLAPAGVPVLFVSGYSQPAAELPGPLLAKPFTAKVLVDTVKRLAAKTLMGS
jgi:CheY-like chemotaxis protein